MLVHSNSVETIEHAPGLLCKKLIDGSTGAASLSLLRGWLKPGCEHARHTHDSEEVVIIIAGQGTMEMDGKLYPVRAGDAMRFPAGSRHATRNDHPTDDLEFIAAFDDQLVDATPDPASSTPTTARRLASSSALNRIRWFARKLSRKLTPRR